MPIKKEIKNINIHNSKVHLEILYPKNLQSFDTYFIFLHEALGSIKQWKDFPQLVVQTTGIPALVYDRFGHGESDTFIKKRDNQYLHFEAIEILPQILAKLNIKQTILFGHSDGGSISLLYAANYPHCVKAVIVEAAHVFVEEFQYEGIKLAGKAFIEKNLRERLFKYHKHKTEDLFYAWYDIWLSEKFKNWNIVNELCTINCPTLVIQGKEDEFGSIKQVEAIVNEVSGYSEKLWIEDCSHIPHLEKKEEIVHKIVRFIQQNLDK